MRWFWVLLLCAALEDRRRRTSAQARRRHGVEVRRRRNLLHDVPLCANTSASASQAFTPTVLFTETGRRSEEGWGTQPLLVSGCRGSVPYAERASLCPGERLPAERSC